MGNPFPHSTFFFVSAEEPSNAAVHSSNTYDTPEEETLSQNEFFTFQGKGYPLLLHMGS